MKKLSCILLAVMLITAMFVSCAAEVIDPYDGLAYVTFGGPASKDLSASYEVQSYESLYWFYTAQKADDFGKTGEVTDETPVSKDGETIVAGLGGQVGPFSQGLWKFELFAYSSSGKEDGTLVYKGSIEGVKLTSSNLTSVPVSVTPQGESGTIEFRNAYFKWAGASGEGKPTIKITAEGPETYTLRSDLTNDDPTNRTFILKVGDKANGILSLDQEYQGVSVGYYKCKVVAWVVDEASPIFEQSFGIRVYGSATTVIYGDIKEAVNTKVTFAPSQADLSVIRGASEVSVDATPSNVDGHKTTIDFGSNLDSSKTYSIQVETSDAATAAGKFSITSGQAAVAGIDLNLVKIEDDGSYAAVRNFASSITVTTYIAAGLDSDCVKVLYGNDRINYLTSYDPNTGKLVFTTDHFSEYYVVTDAVASIGNTGYAFIQDAIDAAKKDDVITILRDIEVRETVKVYGDKQITLNLNGKKIFNDSVNLEKSWPLVSVRENAVLTIEGNGVLKAKENDCFAADVYDEGARLIIKDGEFIGNNHAVYVWGGDLIVNGGTFSIQRPSSNSDKYGYVLNCYDSNYKNGSARIIVTGGTFDRFNPADCSAEGAHTNFVADGYRVSSEEKDGVTWYTVKEATARVLETGETFESLEAAMRYLKDNELKTATIEILSDNADFGFKGKDGDVVNYYNIQDLVGENTSFDITFKGRKGEKKATLNLNTGKKPSDTQNESKFGSNYATGSTLHFENLSVVIGDNSNYQGIIRAKELSFKDCDIVGRGSYWGDGNVVFTGCSFLDNEGDYNITLYAGEKFGFSDCSFTSSAGKFINAYKEQDIVSDVEIKGCSFIGKVLKYPAIFIKPGSVWKVSIDEGTSCTNVNEGANSGSLFYDVRLAENGKTLKAETTVTIGGVVVWENGAKKPN